jgi:hypothetical protein
VEKHSIRPATCCCNLIQHGTFENADSERFACTMVRPISLQRQENSWESAQWEAATSATPIAVYAINYPRFKAKENKTLALLSALMLTVASSGLFAASSLTWMEKNFPVETFMFYRSWTVAFFCIAAFSFMTSCMMAYIFHVLFLTNPKLTSKDAMKDIGPVLYKMPKVYFAIGYLCLVAGTTFYFLCMVDGHATSACLAACFLCMVSPTCVALYRALNIVPKTEVLEAEEARMAQRG